MSHMATVLKGSITILPRIKVLGVFPPFPISLLFLFSLIPYSKNLYQAWAGKQDQYHTVINWWQQVVRQADALGETWALIFGSGIIFHFFSLLFNVTYINKPRYGNRNLVILDQMQMP